MTRRVKQASVVAAIAATVAGGYGLAQLGDQPATQRQIGIAATTPTCLTTLTIPGKRNAKGVVVWKWGTVNPTTTERVCWFRGYIKP